MHLECALSENVAGELLTRGDLSTCDREPIHLLGRVQHFGCLLALTSDWIISRASTNVREYLGLDADALVGTPFGSLIPGEVFAELREHVSELNTEDAVSRMFGVKLLSGSDRTYDLAMHVSGAWIILDIEAGEAAEYSDTNQHVRNMLAALPSCDSVEALCRAAARQVRELTGFDRVMVYRFAADGSGEVVAEERHASATSYLGLHFPASDIPQQARTLYRRNLLRIISDVDDPGSPIVPEFSPDGKPLDLSMSGLRSVSPIHIEYLKNMGVHASLSISILKRGKLWGLFACHHESSRVLPYRIRTGAELYGQIFGFVLDQLEGEIRSLGSGKAQALHHRLMSELADESGLAAKFPRLASSLQTVIECDGVAGYIDGQLLAEGDTPAEEDIKKVVRFLNTAGCSTIYKTDCLGDVFPPAEHYAATASGLLALPVSRTPRDYMMFFRKEFVSTVAWAGDPTKPLVADSQGERLTPRKSFELWQQTVRGRSKPWSDIECEAAESVRVTLLEVILRMADVAASDRARAQERQELLIAELNHRVRNILNLIRGLVTQSSADSRSVADFTDVVGGRIHALARAHDQITQQNWSPASLTRLIDTEVKAYIASKAERVVVKGNDVMLAPVAATTMALVIHELTTNSAKYGALADSRGTVTVELDTKGNGDLSMHWIETGGPPVQAPKRRGFGSAIIERSIPFELKGEAALHYRLAGVEADFVIPAAFISTDGSESVTVDETTTDEPMSSQSAFQHALVVEDNFIIAMDMEALLKRLGVPNVTVAAGVIDADRVLDEKPIDVAVLDVNLGSESSEPIATRLQQASIPFAFATGYGDVATLQKTFPGVQMITKPCQEEALREVLAKLSS